MKRKLSFWKRRFVSPSLPRGDGGKVLLHVGCGRVNSPEFINIDALPYAHVHVVTDNITRLSQFGDETADMVYMSHILEHMRATELTPVLQEMRRVLRPGGILRLSVPDFDRILDVYRASDADLDVIRAWLMGGQDDEYNIHYSVFNRKSLSRLLQETGFRDIRSWDPQNCKHHDFKDKADKAVTIGGQSFAISLNLEALK